MPLVNQTIVGVDGCKGGWVCVSTRPGESPVASLHPNFRQVIERFPPDAMITVDMPIGLPDRGEKGGRVAERAVKELPYVPRSSIFSIPSREAVHHKRGPYASQTERLAAHKEAVAVARRTSPSSSGFSIQAFCIFPKIQEIDDILVSEKALRDRIVESHPEVAFCSLNHWGSLPSKKKNGRPCPLGIKHRQAVLVENGFKQDFLDQKPASTREIKVGMDDFLDAACMMLIAKRKVCGEAKPYPSDKFYDAYGIQIAIWA